MNVVLFSGGVDSTVALLLAQQRGPVLAVAVDYGQTHGIELQSARKIAHRTGVRLIEVAQPWSLLAPASGLTHGELTDANSAVVPGRNMLLLLIAASVGARFECKGIVAGFCRDDRDAFVDCRPAFVQAAASALELGLGRPVTIETPLIACSKSEIFEVAERHGWLDLVIEETHTCYRGSRATRHPWGYGCGRCPACGVRAAGWERATLRCKA